MVWSLKGLKFLNSPDLIVEWLLDTLNQVKYMEFGRHLLLVPFASFFILSITIVFYCKCWIIVCQRVLKSPSASKKR